MASPCLFITDETPHPLLCLKTYCTKYPQTGNNNDNDAYVPHSEKNDQNKQPTRVLLSIFEC